MSILEEIFAYKRRELARQRRRNPLAQLEQQVGYAPLPPDFRAQLAERRPYPNLHLIAEVKHRSPSKGVLAPDFDPLRLAEIYARCGAAAISVLTESRYFGGSLAHLRMIARQFAAPRSPDPAASDTAGAAAKNPMPLLRKDFIFDRYQLLETRIAGASAVLLIAAMLEDHDLAALMTEAADLGLAALVEVHDRRELDRALRAGADLIGINNRNLHTFKVSLETTLALAPEVPSEVVLVSESGIHSPEHVRSLARAGVHAMLVGESLVTAVDVAGQVKMLSGTVCRG